MSLWLSVFSLLRNALGSQAWQQSVASTLDTYLVIEDLSPGSPYQFRVSASNPWGISLPSEPSEFVRLPEYGESQPRPGPQWVQARRPAGCHTPTGTVCPSAWQPPCSRRPGFAQWFQSSDSSEAWSRVMSVCGGAHVYPGPARLPGHRASPGTEGRADVMGHMDATAPLLRQAHQILLSPGNPCRAQVCLTPHSPVYNREGSTRLKE